MYTNQTTGTAHGLLAPLSILTFRLDKADYGQFPRISSYFLVFPRAMSIGTAIYVSNVDTVEALNLQDIMQQGCIFYSELNLGKF